MSRSVAYGLLLLIVVAGLTLRVWNVNFDRGIGSHPDERSTACFYATQVRLPATWDEFWDPQRSPLNPLWNLQEQRRRSFTYGHFPLYLGVAFGELLHHAAPLGERVGLPEPWTALMARADAACDAIAVAGRLVIALLDTLTILLLYLLGRRIYGRGGGLLAAAFYAFTAQAIQLSHFFAMDPASTTFTVLAILGAVQMVQDRNARAVVVAGVGAGLAIASKFSALPILAAPVTASILVAWDSWQRSRSGGAPPDGRAQWAALVGAPLALIIAGLTFFVTSPYAVLDWQNFAQATLVEQGAMVRGIADMPFTRQYRNTVPYLYFIEQQARWGLGWPLGIVTALGTLYAAGVLAVSLFRFVASWFGRVSELLSREALALIVVWSWVLPYFAITGAFLAKFNRYMSPILPFVALFAAGLIWRLWARGNAERDTGRGLHDSADGGPVPTPQSPLSLPQALALLLAVVGVGGGLFWSAAYVNGVYNREHTWITAARWLYEHAPSGSVVLYEQWDDGPPYAIPGEPEMNMGRAGLTTTNWGPYEEDTAEKYEILKAKLREADFVWYSSKRIYGSVVELPERYPMTTRYYEAMWSGELGFELAQDVTSPPRLFGFVFQDRSADESWSLYDHPQVTVFRKVRDLSDAEFDAVLGGTWAQAIPYYRGKDSPLSPLLNVLGLGNRPESQGQGLISRLVGLATGGEGPDPGAAERRSLMLPQPLAELPIVDNYRWNRWASESTPAALLWWWLVLALLGWAAWPLAFYIFRPLRDRGYLLSRTLGWLLAGWLLWWLASAEWAVNSVVNSWLALAVIALTGAAAAIRQWPEMRAYLRTNWPLLLVGEGLFAASYLFFVVLRLFNPDLWQPWLGGEKFMEFAFLNGILRSPYFPPVDPHFAGGFINYYYVGLYLVAYLIKLTGIYAEVAFNLAIPTLFALTVVNAFTVAYSAVGIEDSGFGIRDAEDRAEEAVADNAGAAPIQNSHSWRRGIGAALLAPLFVTLIGNLDGFAQLVRNLAQVGGGGFQSAFGLAQTVGAALGGVRRVAAGEATLPTYDFWGPSRVIPETINEFPYWSFLFADLHPHVIGIPLAAFFLALTYALLSDYAAAWRSAWPRALALLALFALLLGTLASVNLWELPTYLGVGVLALLVLQVRRHGRVHWPLTVGLAVAYLALAYLLYLPFFRNYVGVGASGVGFVKTGDDVGRWLLIWGFFVFMLVSWLLYAASRPMRRDRTLQRPGPAFNPLRLGIVFRPGILGGSASEDAIPADAAPALPAAGGGPAAPSTHPLAGERWLSQTLRFFDRLPRLIYLQRLLVTRPSLAYLMTPTVVVACLLAAGVAWFAGRTVLALCLIPLGPAVVLLWRRSREADPATLLTTILTATGLAILAGTQVVFLKDFLSGGSYYRMNTLFKFFSQVWVLWGVAAAIGVTQLWSNWVAADPPAGARRWPRRLWGVTFVLLLAASLAFPLYGTPARLDMRMVGWRPPVGTLNGLEYMREGSYTWRGRDPFGQELPETRFELRYDWSAIYWLLENVRGNLIIVESAEKDYYRAGGTRAASMTGLSALLGMHAGEQRYGEEVGPRDHLYREFWNTPDPIRTQQIIDELDIALVYVGQLERYLHPDGVEKLAQMAAQGLLTPIYENERTTIYAAAGRIARSVDGKYVAQAVDDGRWTIDDGR
ncbi:MAG: glycosyltransferase family 39 protein [Caldilineaceae bacterium]|nr:glycosyltransferase family 39 protein [Caldilineaceae bacterium]